MAVRGPSETNKTVNVDRPVVSAVKPNKAKIDIDYQKGGGALKNVKAYTDLSNIMQTQFAMDETARDFEAQYQTAAIQRASARENFINQMKMRDMTMEAQLEAFQANQKQVRDQLKFNTGAARRSVRDTNQILADRVTGIGFEQRRLNINREESTNQLAIQKKQAEFAKQDRVQRAENQFDAQKDAAAFQTRQQELQLLADRGKAGASGRRGVSAKRTQRTIGAIAGFNISKINNDLLNFSAIKDQSVKAAEKEQKLTDAQVSLQYNILEKRQNLSKRELGEKLLSANYAYEQSREDIYLDKFKADSQAYANLMSFPRFASAPKKPFVIPNPKYVSPPMPIEVPKGQAPKQPPQRSGLSRALMIAGAVVGAATAPLTAGVSLNMIGAMAPVATAAGGGLLGGLAGFFE